MAADSQRTNLVVGMARIPWSKNRLRELFDSRGWEHIDIDDYEVTSAKQKLNLYCRKHGERWGTSTPDNSKKYIQICRRCSKEAKDLIWAKNTVQWLTNNAPSISPLEDPVQNGRSRYQCNQCQHGSDPDKPWMTSIKSIRLGSRCPMCGFKKNAIKRSISKEVFIAWLTQNRPYLRLIPDSWRSQSKPAQFECLQPDCGNRPFNLPETIKLQGRGIHGCRDCGYKYHAQERWIPSEEVDAILHSSNSLIGQARPYQGRKKDKNFFFCKQCGYGSVPEVEAWATSLQNIQGGSGCPDCAGNAKVTESRFRERLQGIPDIELAGEYVDFTTKVEFKCRRPYCKHHWLASPSRIVSKDRTGCPRCSFYTQDELERIEAIAASLTIYGPFLSRELAIQRRYSFFYDGKPCLNGHLSKRRILGGACEQCLYENTIRTSKRYAHERRIYVEGLDLVCTICDNAFSPVHGKGKRAETALFCSEICRLVSDRAAKDKWLRANPEKRKDISRKYSKDLWTNPNKSVARSNALRRALLYQKARREVDPTFRLLQNMRTYVCGQLRSSLVRKNNKTIELVGCSMTDFAQHIESLWDPGMSWETWKRDGWHIDHIRPVSSFDLTFIVQQQLAFSWANSRPLWGSDNLEKSARYTEEDEHEWVDYMRGLGWIGDLFLLYS